MKRRVDDGNVTIDFRAVFEGVDVGGIDREGVSQVSRSKSITHCKPFHKTNIKTETNSKFLILF